MNFMATRMYEVRDLEGLIILGKDTLVLGLLMFSLWTDTHVVWISVGLMLYLLRHKALVWLALNLPRSWLLFSTLTLVLNINDLHHLCLRFIYDKEGWCVVMAMKPDLWGRVLGSFPLHFITCCGEQLKITATGVLRRSCNIPFHNQIFIKLPLYSLRITTSCTKSPFEEAFRMFPKEFI